MRLIRFITEEREAPRGAMLGMAALAGVADAGLIAILNNAAEEVAVGAMPAKLVTAYLVLFGVLLTALSYALVQAIAAIERALERVKLRIADKVRRSDLRFIELAGGAAAYRSLAQDSGLIAQGAGPLVLVAQQSLVLLFALGYVAVLSPPTLVVTLLVLALAVPMIVRHAERTRADLKAAGADEEQVFDALGGMLAGFKELQLNRAERRSSPTRPRTRASTPCAHCAARCSAMPRSTSAVRIWRRPSPGRQSESTTRPRSP
jgi:putative pyoverdin transport system ATP-binding/permease protein